MLSTTSIRFHIATKTAPWVILFLLFAGIAVLFLEKTIFNERLNNIQDERVNRFVENKNRVLEGLLGQVTAIANNDLVINGLVDTANSERYLPALINSYSLAGTTNNSVKIVDFNGKAIVSNGVDISHSSVSDSALFAEVMDTAIAQYKYTKSGILFIAPILWSSAAEGAVVIEVSFDNVTQLLKVNLLGGEILYLNNDESVLFSSNSQLTKGFLNQVVTKSTPTVKQDPIYNNWYYKKYTINDDHTIYSFEQTDSIKNKLHGFVLLGLFSLFIAFLGSLISIFLASSIVSKTLSKLLRALKDRKEGHVEDTGYDVNLNDPEELVQLYQNFDSILSDLSRSETFGNDIQSIINSLNEYLVVFDMDGDVSLLNASFQKFDDSVIDDLSVYEKIVPTDLQNKALSAHEVIKDFERIYQVIDTENNTHERVIRWSRSLYMTNSSTVGGLTFIGVDITEEKANEKNIQEKSQAIHDLSQRFTLALETAAIGIWEFNADDDQLIWDNRMHEIFQIPKEEFTGSVNDWIGCVHPQDFEITNEMLLNSLSTGNNFLAEYRIIWPNNEVRWISANARVVTDMGVLRVVGVNIDITATKRLNEELEEALIKAEELVKTKSEFLASMSHEIRTPMNGVLGMLNLLKRTELSLQQDRYTELAHSSANSLLALINDILDFSKVDAGKLELEYIDFNLPDTLGELAESMAQRAQDKGLELVLDIAEIKTEIVNGDPSRLRQIINNLVGNAIKFTEKGEILIKANIERNFKGDLLFTASVIDTGIGIPENKIDSLFDSFSQVDASTTRKYGGTGLGLAIVKQLCELMGGDIDINSQFNKGSEFSFSLIFKDSVEMPLDDDAEPGTASLDLESKSIMLIDDNLMNGEALKKQFSVWHAQVDIFNNIDDSLKFLGDGHIPSLILIDAKMPDMNGLAFAQHLRREQRYDNTKIVLMTDIDSITHTQELKTLGLTSSFPKPATRKDLLSALFTATDVHDDTEVEKIVPEKKPKPILKPTANNKNVSNTRILLVEDNLINQEVALGILNSLELTADIAENGLAALNILNEKSYDVVLMDCQMPEMDGYAATRAIRLGKTLQPTIPIIAMTANAMKGDKEKCLTAGMDDYLSKPIDPQQLIEKINEWSKPNTSEANNQEVQAMKSITDQQDNAIIWDRNDFMNRIMNNEVLAQKLVNLFKVDTPKTIKDLGLAVDNNLANDAGLLAHKLKGTVSNLGGIELADLAHKIEQAGREDDIESIKGLWPQVMPKYDQLLGQIERGL